MGGKDDSGHEKDGVKPEALTGIWTRTSTEDCAAPYPTELALKTGGIYYAPGGPEAGSIWHGGDWDIIDDRITIQMANDEMRVYGLLLDDRGMLSFEDDMGCTVRYRRLPG